MEETIKLSAEQRPIVNCQDKSVCVVACAGSGKTVTAVYRVEHLRRRLSGRRGRVALLSFSNAAVEAFLGATRRGETAGRPRLRGLPPTIATFDAFLTTYVLRPHAHRTMNCQRTPFLVQGAEPFLRNKQFQFWAQSANKRFPVTAEDVTATFGTGGFEFSTHHFSALLPVPNGEATAKKIGRFGAYTHALGHYWAYRVLKEQPFVLRALARRFPFVIVDEAQDIHSSHGAILDLMQEAGVAVSLIGDPCQAIYEFAGADGSLLRAFGSRSDVSAFTLSTNRRSTPPIVTVANAVSARSTNGARADSDIGRRGAYFVGYEPGSLDATVKGFTESVQEAGLGVERSAVLCRSSDLVRRVRKIDSPAGRGVVRLFCTAATLRDRDGDLKAAYGSVVRSTIELLEAAPKDLLARLLHPSQADAARPVARELWAFTRDHNTGLPPTSLPGATDWHRALKTNVQALLAKVQTLTGLKPVANLGQRLAKTKLPTGPLAAPAAAPKPTHSVRVDTVHSAKGETLDAVLYVTNRAHANGLCGGVSSEIGRIGYVALTRARDLFWLAVPAAQLDQLRPALQGLGLVELDGAQR